MGKALGTILGIAVAIFAPYLAGALGLSGFGATLFKFALQGVVSMVAKKSSIFGGGGGGSGAGGTGDKGLLLNQQGTSNPVYVIYGERRIGANRVFIDTTNGGGGQTGEDRDEYLHQVFSVAEGEIGWINSMHLQDRLAWVHPEIFAYYNSETSDDVRFQENNPYFKSALANNEELTYTEWLDGVDPGEDAEEDQRYHGFDSATGYSKYYLDDEGTKLFNLKLYRGEDNQTRANAWYESDADEDWLSDQWLEQDRDGKKIAWAYLRLKYDRDVFGGAPTVQFDVLGKRVENQPYTGTLVRNDTYENTYDDLLSYTNPANAIYDYLTDTVYGKGLSPDLIDRQKMDELGNYCYSKGLECNGVINPEASIFDNTDRLLNTANSYIVNSQGRYVLLPLDSLDFTDAYEFNQDNILGEWNIQLGSKKAMMNRVKVNWFNPAENWQADIYTYPEDDTNNPYLALDSDVLNEKSLDLPMVSVERQAQAFGEFIVKLSRFQDMVNFKTTWTALKLDVGDPVVITHPTPGWTQKRFRVTSMTLMPDGTVDVTLMEYPDEYIWMPYVIYDIYNIASVIDT